MGFQVKLCLQDNSVTSSKHLFSQLLEDCDLEVCSSEEERSLSAKVQRGAEKEGL